MPLYRTPLLVAAVLAPACSPDAASPDFSEPVHLTQLERLLTAGSHLTRIGSALDSATAFSWISAARISPDGSHIAVLDRDPPFLRLFSASGRPIRAMVSRGGGPSESHGAVALGMSMDTAILVERGALILVSLRDDSVMRLPPLPVNAQDVDFGCGEQWIVYGPSREMRPRYVHFLTIDSGAAIRRSIHIDTTRVRAGWGDASPNLVIGVSAALIRHRTAEHEELLIIDCAGRPVDAPWAWAPGLMPSSTLRQAERVASRGDVMAMQINPTIPFHAGSAQVSDQLLWLEARFAPKTRRPRSLTDFEERTYFYLIRQDGMYAGYVVGTYTLQDVRAHHVLLATEIDFPRLLYVPWYSLKSVLEQGEFRSRSQ